MKRSMLFVVTVLFMFSHYVFAGSACPGKVSRLYVEHNDDLYFSIQAQGQCVCNFTHGYGKGFLIPKTQDNKEEAYSALLAAYMADRGVTIWFDWTSATVNESRCRAWNVVFE